MRIETVHLKDIYPVLGENGKDPVLTCYMPDNLSEMSRDNKKHKAMVVCPGGGYAFVSQREAEPIALKLMAMDFYVFVLSYSVAPHAFPSQLLEAAAVFDFLHQHADEWHVDADKIAIMGFSAGGHLAAHYSTAFDCAVVREHFPYSYAPCASVLCYPVITSDERYAHKGSFVNLLGQGRDYSESAAYDVTKLVTDHTPMAFIWHTAADRDVPVTHSLLYAQALAEHHIPFELHIFPVGCHGLSTGDALTCDGDDPVLDYIARWIPALKKWADTYLG